ncbi:MAG: surface lipoprotein assembly modifier [Natronospirillum sp.]
MSRFTLGVWRTHSLKQAIRSIVFALIASLSLLAVPALASVAQEIDQLLQQDRHEAAYQLALEHRFEQEGDLDFDFYYGMAAIERGHFSEGVFALERVVMRRPGFSRARLELARGYFLMGDDARANHHFDRVRAQDPPPTVIANIDRYQQRMRARAKQFTTSINGHLGLALGYDTNVNSATAENSVEILFGGGTAELTLPEASRAASDVTLGTMGEISVLRPLTERQSLFLRGDFEARGYPFETTFNTVRGGLRGGTRWQGDTFTPSASLRAQTFFLDGDHYQNVYGLSLGLRQQFSDVLMANYGVDYSRMDYDDRPNNDADVLMASAGVTQAWNVRWQPMTSLSAFAGRVLAHESTAGAKANTERWQLGLNGMARAQLDPAWSLTGRTQYRHSAYEGENALFGKTRAEHFFQASVGADWTLLPQLQVTPQIEYRSNASNIDIYTYDRALVETQLRYRF